MNVDESSPAPAPRHRIQDAYDPGFHECFGCGRNNPHGLQLGCWQEGDSVCAEWTPLPHLQGPAGMLHGGVTALLMDEVGSAAAFVEYHRRDGVAIGEGRPPFFVTASLSVDYHRPVAINGAVTLRGWTTNRDDLRSPKAWIECTLQIDGKDAARGRILFVRTDPERYAADSSL